VCCLDGTVIGYCVHSFYGRVHDCVYIATPLAEIDIWTFRHTDVSFRLLNVAAPHWSFQPKPKAAFRLASFWCRSASSTHNVASQKRYYLQGCKKPRFVYSLFRFVGVKVFRHYLGVFCILHFQSDRVSYITPIRLALIVMHCIEHYTASAFQTKSVYPAGSATFILSTAFWCVSKRPYINFGELVCRRVVHKAPLTMHQP